MMTKKRSLQSKVTDLNVKLDKVEERFAYGEIDRGIYDKIGGKLKEEINQINVELEKTAIKLSNPSKLIDFALDTSVNLLKTWKIGNYDERVKLQRLAFPEGIYYDRKIDHYRTENLNSILSAIHLMSAGYKENKKGQTNRKIDLSYSVAPGRLEP